MFGFDGEYRRKREQNFSGASRHTCGKDALINRAHEERLRRQNDKRLEMSVVKIQKVVRSFQCRLRLSSKFNAEFVERLESCNYREIIPSDVQYLLARLHFASYDSLNSTYLEMVIKNVLTIGTQLLKLASSNFSWLWRLNIFLEFVLEMIEKTINDKSFRIDIKLLCEILDTLTPINNPMRIELSKKIFLFLFNKNYLIIMRDFLNFMYSRFETRTNSQISESMINIAVQMILRPLTLMNGEDETYKYTVLDSFFRMIVAEENLNNSLKCLVFPNIALIKNFPLETAVNIFLNYSSDFYIPSAEYLFLTLDKDQSSVAKEFQMFYFKLLSLFLFNSMQRLEKNDSSSDSVEFEEFKMANNNSSGDLFSECLQMINRPERARVWMNTLTEELSNKNYNFITLHSICVFHMLILCGDSNSLRIINDLWCAEGWLRGLWLVLMAQQRKKASNEATSLLKYIKKGMDITQEEAARILPLLGVFSYFLFGSLSFITNDELKSSDLIEKKGIKPFTLNELIYIGNTLKDVAIGLITLGYQEPVFSDTFIFTNKPTDRLPYNCIVWSFTLKMCIKVVGEIFKRESQCKNKIIEKTGWETLLFPISENYLQRFVEQSFEIKDMTFLLPFNPLTQENMKHYYGNSTGSWYYKTRYILTYLPFTVNINHRYKMLYDILAKEKNIFQNPHLHILNNKHLTIMIRRDYIYEDAFDQLSLESVPELAILLRIQFTNRLNIDEVGIDGGGLLREFINELLQTAFNPDRGFFILTKDNRLYPNPNVSNIYRNFKEHYFFIGRIIGKAILENIVVDIPLADVFLAKILQPEFIYPSYFDSLDKDLFKNITFLRKYGGDYSVLELDFTTTSNSFGNNVTVELKPHGADIAVTEENLIEYINLMAKQKLHVDIMEQAESLTQGLLNVLPKHVFRMFTTNELQHIISGSNLPIDQHDLKNNVIYSSGITQNHPIIMMFWKVFESFSDKERRQLIKFVTSCSRPPLRGFKDLQPPFCIQLVDLDNNRLPTASTCMNILKLPIYSDEITMREKLVYAIQSGAGFDLS